MRRVAIDPGDIHVGVAVFVGANCIEAYEVEPAEILVRMERWMVTEALDEVIVEAFRLYPWMAKNQGFSEFLTPQLIGAIKYVVARFGNMQVIEQPATVKKPVQAQLKASGIKSVAKANKAGGHAFDAELHGWARVRGFGQ